MYNKDNIDGIYFLCGDDPHVFKIDLKEGNNCIWKGGSTHISIESYINCLNNGTYIQCDEKGNIIKEPFKTEKSYNIFN